VAVNVIAKFVQEDQVPTKVLQDIVTKSCAAFSAPDVTPLVTVHGHSILVCYYYRGPFFVCVIVCICRRAAAVTAPTRRGNILSHAPNPTVFFCT
jgi:hypothetical protein